MCADDPLLAMPETFVEEGYYDDLETGTGAVDAKGEMTRPPTEEEMANPLTAMVRGQMMIERVPCAACHPLSV